MQGLPGVKGSRGHMGQSGVPARMHVSLLELIKLLINYVMINNCRGVPDLRGEKVLQDSMEIKDPQ